MLGRFGETLVVDWGVAKMTADATVRATRLFPRAWSQRRALAHATWVGDRDAAVYESGAGLGRAFPKSMPASDVYGLGATLYCLLVGHGPFPSGDVADVLHRVSRGIFPAPRRLRRSIDPKLEAICLKAMALRPEDRHADGSCACWRDRSLAGRSELSERAGTRSARGEAIAGRLEHRASAEPVHPGYAQRGDALAVACPGEHSAGLARPSSGLSVRACTAGMQGRSWWNARCHTAAAVHAVVFSPDGRILATAGADRRAAAVGRCQGWAALIPDSSREGDPGDRVQPGRANCGHSER